MNPPKVNVKKSNDESENKRKQANFIDTKDDLKSQIEVIKEKIDDARRFIVMKKYNEAFKVLNDPLKNFVDSNGEGHIELLPGYFALAEAYICINSLKKAEHFLISAYGNLLKLQDELPKLPAGDQLEYLKSEISVQKANLAKTIGRFYFANEKYDKALDEFATCIYLDSLQHGPENVLIASHYYYLGNTFLKLNRVEEAKKTYAKYVFIWKEQTKNSIVAEGGLEEDVEAIYYDEAADIINTVLGFFEQQCGNLSEYSADCSFVLGLIRMKSGDPVIAGQYLQKSFDKYNYCFGQMDDRTMEVQSFITLNNNNVDELKMKMKMN